MGYQATFTPTEEAMEKYKPNAFDKTDEYIENSYNDLLIYCLQDHTNDSTKDCNFYIKLNLETLSNYIKRKEQNSAYLRWKEDKDHQLWYCGWDKRENYSSYDKEDSTKYTLENLLLFCKVVQTEGYYVENTHFFDKLNSIKDSLDYFIEAIEDIEIHKIMEELDEFRKRDEES